jgi:hypothetical protein
MYSRVDTLKTRTKTNIINIKNIQNSYDVSLTERLVTKYNKALFVIIARDSGESTCVYKPARLRLRLATSLAISYRDSCDSYFHFSFKKTVVTATRVAIGNS